MMDEHARRLRQFNRAGQVQYEWFDEVADYIEDTNESLRITKALYVEALRQNIKLEEKLEDSKKYWYDQGHFDAIMEMNEDKKE